jgi:hypothetical protein
LGEGFGARAQAVGAAFQGVRDDLAEVVVRAQPLEDDIPEGDQGSEGPRIKVFIPKRQPARDEGQGQKLVKLGEQLAGRETGAQQWRWWRLGFVGGGAMPAGRLANRFKGVFFDCI